MDSSVKPSKAPVGYPPESDWEIAKRKRSNPNIVRYRNNVTAQWDVWLCLEPGDRDYDEEAGNRAIERQLDVMRDEDALLIETATVGAAHRMSDSMGQVDIATLPPALVAGFAQMTRDELRKLAAEAKIKGRGSMSKDELVAAVTLYTSGE